MSIFLLFSVLTWAFLFVSGFIFTYHAFLASVALIPRPRVHVDSITTCLHRIAIVIPAHDEEDTIHIALDSCRGLDYPADKYEIFVVADNCNDHTAAVAESYGVRVLVRDDAENRGKGYALHFAFEQVLESVCDAVLVLDADCRIHPDTLRVADDRLCHGGRVLQCNNRVANSNQSATTLLLAAANALENDFFYAPKSRLGWFVLLRGTGMIFHREILERYPWDARCVIEDAQYSYRLAQEGITARFLPEVDVVSDLPVNRSQLNVQRQRWFGGGVRFAWQLSPRMLLAGLRQGNLLLIDAAISSWIIMRPFVVAQLGITLFLALAAWWFDPGSFASPLAVGLTITIVAGYVLYALLGFVTLQPTWKSVRLLLQAPVVLATYLGISARTLLQGSPRQWRRTPRESARLQ